MMPASANQAPAPGQKMALSTERVASSIPRADADATWSYPSPQMFWNALVRKDKVAGSTEEDMDAVIAIHNNMNELTWMQVLAWEALHPPHPQSERARACARRRRGETVRPPRLGRRPRGPARAVHH